MGDSTKITSNNLLLPPANPTSSMSVPKTTPQKLGSSGSATGNPRNKCALKPGHSLMDWIRLGNSGVDLSGTKGRVIPVDSTELARHNTPNDAWLAIRGQVFNVTRYMDFHPGGVDELMRGVGRDATKLFDEVHAWVNYQQLLAKCYIGPLKSTAKIDADIFNLNKTKTKADTFAKPPVPTEILPRLDWIQRRAEITFYIYTRQFCNPGLVLQHQTNKNIRVLVQIGTSKHELQLELHEVIEWPPNSVKISSESGKIEIVLTKSSAELWDSYGAHKLTKLSPGDNMDELFVYKIVAHKDFNHDSFELLLQADNGDTIMWLPLGYHVSICCVINGTSICRSYTPVDSLFLSETSNESNATKLNFLIKEYAEGILSSHLAGLQIGDSVQISPPKGGLSLKRLLQHNRIALLAAGSGLTPFLNLLQHLLQRSTNRVEHLQLFYFNKTEKDIWCLDKLNQITAKDERFSVTHILSAADVTWTGSQGRVSSELLAPVVDKKSIAHATFIAICGPSGFNQNAEEILKELNFNMDNLHLFQG